MSETFSDIQLQLITDCSMYSDPRVSLKEQFFCVDCSAGEPATRESCPLCKPFLAIPDERYDGVQRNYVMEKLLDLHQLYVERTSYRSICIPVEKLFGKTYKYILFPCLHISIFPLYVYHPETTHLCI